MSTMTKIITIKKVWFNEGRGSVCYPCNSPYNKNSIINTGIKYEDWIKIETFKNGIESEDGSKCNAKRMKR